MRFLKNAFLFFILSVILFLAAQEPTVKANISHRVRTDGSLEFTIRTNTYNGDYAPRHVMAIWITDAQDHFVKTLKVRAQARRSDLVKWNQMSAGNTVSAVTGATLNAHATHNVTWDCTNVQGAQVADGTYKIYVEMTEDDSHLGSIPDGPYAIYSFEKGSQPYNATPANQTSFSNADISYTPAFSFTVTAFTAEAVNPGLVNLSFIVTNESNLMGYHLLRSAGGIANATQITSTLLAAHNTAGANEYTFADNAPLAGETNYYYLQVVAANGSTDNSNECNVSVPPYLEVLSFAATAGGTVSWTTQNEFQLSGYYLYRSNHNSFDTAVALNSEIIPLNGSGNYLYNDTSAEAENTYYYFLQAVINGGQTLVFGPVQVTITAASENTDAYSRNLLKVSPNPFNPNLRINVDLPYDSDILLKIVNIKGETVRVLSTGSVRKGVKVFNWNGKNYRGNNVASGIYFILLKTEKATVMKKAMLVK